MKSRADPASMVGHPKRQSKSFGAAVCKPKVVKFKLIAMDMGECDRAVVVPTVTEHYKWDFSTLIGTGKLYICLYHIIHDF